MNPDSFLTTSLVDRRVTRVLAAAIDAVEPGLLVTKALHDAVPPRLQRTSLLGLGKAAEAMTLAAAAWIPDFAAALIITKHARPTEGVAKAVTRSGSVVETRRITIMEAGHPVPDQRSIAAGEAALRFASQVGTNDLLVCLVSGGGSALATAPVPGTTLADLQWLTTELLQSGASIDEINILRRQLDRLKGGGIAAAAKGRILSLILSDVPGDHLEAIASGPTVPDPTTPQDAMRVLEKYGVHPPAGVDGILRAAPRAKEAAVSDRVENLLVGSNRVAMASAAEQASIEGISTKILDGALDGEARHAGIEMAEILRSMEPGTAHPSCMIVGGETTVKVTGGGKGGRNQELVLAAVDRIRSLENCLLVALATDGEDGPTDAAGAVVTGQTWHRATSLGMKAEEYLRRNDAYSYFDALGDLIKTGPTGTNVNDLVLLLRL